MFHPNVIICYSNIYVGLESFLIAPAFLVSFHFIVNNVKKVFSLSYPSDDTLSLIGSPSSSNSSGSLESPNPIQSGKDVFFQAKQEAERRNLIVDIIEHESEKVWKFISFVICLL